MCASARMVVKRKGASAPRRRRRHPAALRPAIRARQHAGGKRRRRAPQPSALRQVLRAGRRGLQPVTTDLDVVIPTLNAARSLAPTLDSLGGDHGLRLSVTVCDGGSRDDTTAIARWAGANVLVTGPGRGRQLGEGAMAGSAPWLLFLHADTTLSTGWAAAVRQFMAMPTPKAGYFRLRFASTDPRARRLERLVAWRCRTFGLPYGDQGLLIERDFYRRHGRLSRLAFDGRRRLRAPHRPAQSSQPSTPRPSPRPSATNATAGCCAPCATSAALRSILPACRPASSGGCTDEALPRDLRPRPAVRTREAAAGQGDRTCRGDALL